MQVYQQQMKSIKDKFPKRFLNNEAIGKQYKTIKKEINKDHSKNDQEITTSNL